MADGYTYDPDFDVYIDDDTFDVVDEDGNYLGDVAQFYDEVGATGDLELAAQIESVTERIMELEAIAEAEANAVRALEDAQIVAEEQENEALAVKYAQHWAVNRFARNHLDRRLSLTQASQILRGIEDQGLNMTDEDIQHATAVSGIESFDAPGWRGAKARREYIDSRMAEVEAANQDVPGEPYKDTSTPRSRANAFDMGVAAYEGGPESAAYQQLFGDVGGEA